MTDLRGYQTQAVEQLDRATRALYTLPTGGGKTVVATNLLNGR
jgi:superfamily II DNA or RNA helicase